MKRTDFLAAGALTAAVATVPSLASKGLASHVQETDWAPAPYQLAWYKRYFIRGAFPFGDGAPHLVTTIVLHHHEYKARKSFSDLDESAHRELARVLKGHKARLVNTYRFRDGDVLPGQFEDGRAS